MNMIAKHQVKFKIYRRFLMADKERDA